MINVLQVHKRIAEDDMQVTWTILDKSKILGYVDWYSRMFLREITLIP
jgi:hypothetical protein